MANPVDLLWVVLKATLLSTGGFGNLPAVYEEVVTRRGWLTGAQVAEAVGIGQVAPGPNGLWVVSLGYFVDGVRGGLLATLAVAVPPLLVLPLLHVYHKNRDHPLLDGFVRGMALAATSLGVVILLQLLSGSGGITVRATLTALAAFGLMATRRVPVPLILLVAAAVGLVGR